MKNLKNFDKFFETYSEDVEKLVEKNSKYALIKNNEILLGFDNLEEAFIYLTDVLTNDDQIDFDDKVIMEEDIKDNVTEEMEQVDIDKYLKSLLDKYDVVASYKIEKASEIIDEPIDKALEDEEILGESKASCNCSIECKCKEKGICTCGDNCDCEICEELRK